MHVYNRDALNVQIKAITAETGSKLDSAHLRLEQQKSQAAKDQQRLMVELEETTIERDELLVKVEQLNNVIGK